MERLQPRQGRLLLASAGVLFVLFGVLIAHQLMLRQRRFVGDPARLAELSAARILDQDSADGSKEWPQWRGPHRDGAAAPFRLATTWPTEGPPELWRAAVGEGYSSFAVADGKAYTLMRDPERPQEVVVCWELQSGKELWRRGYECPTPRIDFGPGPRSTPCVDRDRLYTVGASGLFHCFAVADGKPLWRHDLLREFDAPQLKWGVSFSPLVDGDLVFAIPGGRNGSCVAAFDKLTGEPRWKALHGAASYSSPIVTTAAGKRQILFFTAEGLASLSPEGKEYWRFGWRTSNDVNAATPLAFQAEIKGRAADLVFLSSGYSRGCALLELTSESGAPSVQSLFESDAMNCHFSSPVRYRNYLYGFNEAKLTCLDVRTGDVKWEQKGFKKGSLLLAEGHLVILAEDGLLALAEATPDGYRETAQCHPFRGCRRAWTPPVASGGLLLLRDDKEVVCLDLRSPSPAVANVDKNK
jgi:outer membrane protein assembly factor BamB